MTPVVVLLGAVVCLAGTFIDGNAGWKLWFFGLTIVVAGLLL